MLRPCRHHRRSQNLQPNLSCKWAAQLAWLRWPPTSAWLCCMHQAVRRPLLCTAVTHSLARDCTAYLEVRAADASAGHGCRRLGHLLLLLGCCIDSCRLLCRHWWCRTHIIVYQDFEVLQKSANRMIHTLEKTNRSAQGLIRIGLLKALLVCGCTTSKRHVHHRCLLQSCC